MPERLRYAVWATLDSLNDTGNSAKNDHYGGAFTSFACFVVICRRQIVKIRGGLSSICPEPGGLPDLPVCMSRELMNEPRSTPCDAAFLTARPAAWTMRCSRRRRSSLLHLSCSRQ